jgi:DNA invertase Pin-like site-specific DNA recombinase
MLRTIDVDSESLKLEDALKKRQITLQFIMQPIDLSTASGKLSFTIFAATAEHESTVNGERTKGGLAVKRANGVRLGRPPALDDKQIILARKMFEVEDISLSAIGRTFAVSPNTIKRALND